MAAATAQTLLLFFFLIVLLSLFSLASASTNDFSTAPEILSDSGYLSMALTLQLISTALNLGSRSATVFAPSDAAFARSGQLPLRLLKYHISPIRLTIEALRTLPYGTPIPTTLLHHPLIVTTARSGDKFSINTVSVEDSAIYDDGSVVVYGTDEFFDSSFPIPADLAPEQSPPPETSTRPTTAHLYGLMQQETYGSLLHVGPFGPASDLLRSRGYSIIAAFLEAQLLPVFTNQARLTIFAPVDAAFEEYVRNFSDYSWVFRRHVVPRLLPWKDLDVNDDIALLPTFWEGFSINVTGSGDVLLLNDVPVMYPDMYYSNWLVVHGVNRLLIPLVKKEPLEDSFSELDGEFGVKDSIGDSFSELGGNYDPLDYGEFGSP